MLLASGGDEGFGRGAAFGVARNRHHLEVAVFQLLAKSLPDRQVKAAASPGGPEEQKDLLALELRESVQVA
jgi:hypothetical protein